MNELMFRLLNPFYWRRWWHARQVSRVATRAVRDGYTEMNESECISLEAWCKDYKKAAALRAEEKGKD